MDFFGTAVDEAAQAGVVEFGHDFFAVGGVDDDGVSGVVVDVGDDDAFLGRAESVDEEIDDGAGEAGLIAEDDDERFEWFWQCGESGANGGEHAFGVSIVLGERYGVSLEGVVDAFGLVAGDDDGVIGAAIRDGVGDVFDDAASCVGEEEFLGAHAA